MVGDRYLIDTVFGNKHGMLTIRPAPLTLHGEPKAVVAVRRHPCATALVDLMKDMIAERL